MGSSAREGSGVKFGEMEIKMLCASGLPRSVQSLRDRQDMVDGSVCTACNLLQVSCTCPAGTTHAMFRMPRGTAAMTVMMQCAVRLGCVMVERVSAAALC